MQKKTYRFFWASLSGIILPVFLSCTTNYGNLNFKADLPFYLEENSGIISLHEGSFWLIEDNGNKETLYNLDLNGDVLKSLHVKNANNADWEDLTKDTLGNIYIADFGNNGNTRKDLVIYKLTNPEHETGNQIGAKKIKFNYPEQKEFPPKDAFKFFDAEALFHWNHALYIITKNRSNPFTGDAFLYKIPDVPGNYKAELIAKIDICDDLGSCQITAVDISTDGKKVIALSYGKLFIYTNFVGEDFSNGKKEIIDLGTRAQLESLCFLNDSTLLISDERTISGKGCNLYTYQLNLPSP